jgi:predicted PurR-regulated permease PerM
LVYAVSFLIFAMFVFIGVFFIDVSRQSRAELAQRLGIQDFDVQYDVRKKSAFDSFADSFRKRLGSILPGVAVEDYNRKLQYAGRPFNMRGEDIYILKVVLGALPVVVLPVFLIVGTKGTTALLLAILAFVGYFLPDYWLKSKIQTRQRDI